MDREITKKIIDAGNQAPSGSNSLPWKFKVTNDVIEIVALPEKDHAILNFNNRGTYLAHGALMENMEIAARSLGFEPVFELFPQPNISARIALRPSAKTENDGLFEAVYTRHSNRKPYQKLPLTDKDKAGLFLDVNKFPECELAVVEGEKIPRVAESAASDMEVFLQNQLLHKLLFREVLWKEEEQKSLTGLYIKTMEATGPKSLAMKMLKNWRVAKFLNKLDVPKKIHQENAKTASSAGLIGAVMVRNDDINFIHAGRLMENVWLRAAKLDLSFQLMAGMVFLWQQANFGRQETFSEKEKDIINKAYKNLAEIFGAKDKIIALMFRIGWAEKPLAVSYKRPPEIEWK